MKEYSTHFSPFHKIPQILGILGTSQVGIYFHKDMQLDSKQWVRLAVGNTMPICPNEYTWNLSSMQGCL